MCLAIKFYQVDYAKITSLRKISIAAVKYLKNYLIRERIEEFQEGKFRASMEWALSIGASSAFINGNS